VKETWNTMAFEDMETTIVSDLMSRIIHSVDHLSSVLSCAETINHNDAPAVLVTRTEENEKLINTLRIKSGEIVVGIVTPGDILRKNVEKCADPCVEVTEKIMTSSLIHIRPESTIREALALMLTKNVEKLVVASNENLVVGTITMADIAVAFLGSPLTSGD